MTKPDNAPSPDNDLDVPRSDSESTPDCGETDALASTTATAVAEHDDKSTSDSTELDVPERRPRWIRRTVIAVSSVVVLLVALLGGAGWYFSGQVVGVEHNAHTYPFEILSVDDGTVTLPKDPATTVAGVWGLDWGDGRGVVAEVLESDATTVTRRLVESDPLKPGTMIRMDTWAYATDPMTDFGLEYTYVDVPGPLGDLPSWFVAADSDTWVIAVHGRNSNENEALRALPQLHASGFPVLSITYRNDIGAPDAPDGLHHLGATESQDVEAAIDYALGKGAKSVILAGWSMGGAIVMSTLRNMDDPSVVVGVLLDSPVLDWSSTLDKQGDQRSLPGILTDTAKLIVEWRVDVDLDDLDQRLVAQNITTPILLFCDTADDTVDSSASLEFAESVPAELMTLVTTAVGHTASWNEDPAAYDLNLASWLATL